MRVVRSYVSSLARSGERTFLQNALRCGVFVCAGTSLACVWTTIGLGWAPIVYSALAAVFTVAALIPSRPAPCSSDVLLWMNHQNDPKWTSVTLNKELIERGFSFDEFHVQVEHLRPMKLTSRSGRLPRHHYATRRAVFPFMWRLAQYLLDHKTRDRIYKPILEELREDYAATKRVRSLWARRWLNFCFSIRIAVLLIACFRTMVGSATLHAISSVFPVAIRDAMRRFLRLN
jgi:hypothetical protein